MSKPIDGQIDIFEAIESAERHERTAALPRTFTTSTAYTPTELADAFDAWVDEHGRFGCLAASHMWHPALCAPFGSDGAHSVWVMTAALHSGTGGRTVGVGELVTRSYCSDCQWWSPITDDEDGAVRAYHDHCWPGWRDLPVLPLAASGKPVKIPTDYPEDWQIPGAPIVTTRDGIGMRNVPGRSPFGGYDLADPAEL